MWINNGDRGDVVHGFLVLGAPQREYDTPQRIHYSEHQLAAVQFAGDYLELAISREIVARAAEHDKARAESVAHLEGIEPEVRGLLDCISSAKVAQLKPRRK